MKIQNKNKRIIFLLIIYVLISLVMNFNVSAANYYVSPAGNDNNPGTINSPWASPLKAWQTATAGDTVFFRGGTYHITSHIWTNYYGNSGTQSNPIIFRNYPGESVTFNGGTLQNMITIEKNWNIISGINFIGGFNQLQFGDDFHITGGIVENCISSGFQGGDNMGFVVSNQATGIIIRNCSITGPGTTGVHGNTAGIIAFNAYGIKILNNEISNVPIGIYYKHGQVQTADTGVEIAYNHIFNTSRQSMELNSYGANIHNNIIGRNNALMLINSDNGGSNGNYNKIIHNTFYEQSFYLEGAQGNGKYNTFRDNIYMRPVSYFLYRQGPHYSTTNYNLYPSVNAVQEYVEGSYYTLSTWKTHYGQDQNSIAGTPTFLGGTMPNLISGYELAPTSIGKNAASDGTDMGAKVCAVGRNPNCGASTPNPDTTAPSQVSGLTATAVSSSQINLAWTPASDNVEVTGYRIFRNNIQIATSATTTYQDTGLTQGTTYNYRIAAYDSAGNIGTQSNQVSATTTLQDTTPPTLSNGAPSGTLPAGTTSATLSLSTNEAATCRYSTTTGVAYASMTNTFTTTGNTIHSRIISGLINGSSYNFYVKCIDNAGNINTNDFIIIFNISTSTTSLQNECNIPKSGRIWCDDFETNRLSSYFEYNNNSGDFIRVAGVGIDGSTGMRAIWQPGEQAAGDLKVSFGRKPGNSFSPAVDAGTSDYKDIYWRIYVKNQPGWTGGGADKLSRAIIFATSGWAQAAISHVWSVNTNYLGLDPTSGTDSAGNLKTTTYNDFQNMRWLGLQQGTTPLFNSANVGQWHCIEAHMKLNDAGQSNGINELWINDILQSRQNNLNWIGNYSNYGINAIFFENYWNTGSPVTQERYFDNIVISTQRIGCENQTIINLEGDINSDKVVNILDINTIIPHFGKTNGYPNGINLAAPPVIDLFDVMVIIRNWGKNQ